MKMPYTVHALVSSRFDSGNAFRRESPVCQPEFASSVKSNFSKWWQLVCYTGWNCAHISTVLLRSPLLCVRYRIYFKLLVHATSLKALHVMSWHLNLQASKASVGFQRNVHLTSRTLAYDHRDFSFSGTRTAELSPSRWEMLCFCGH